MFEISVYKLKFRKLFNSKKIVFYVFVFLGFFSEIGIIFYTDFCFSYSLSFNSSKILSKPKMAFSVVVFLLLLFIFYCQYVIQNTMHNNAFDTEQTYTA